MQLEYLDLYLLHAPVALEHTGIPFTESTPRDAAGNAKTSRVPLSATWKAMEHLMQAGLCRHVGVSNFSLDQIDEVLDAVAASRPLCNQVMYLPP